MEVTPELFGCENCEEVTFGDIVDTAIEQSTAIPPMRKRMLQRRMKRNEKFAAAVYKLFRDRAAARGEVLSVDHDERIGLDVDKIRELLELFVEFAPQIWEIIKAIIDSLAK